MTRHRRINQGTHPAWRWVSALVGVVALVASMAVTASTASAETPTGTTSQQAPASLTDPDANGVAVTSGGESTSADDGTSGSAGDTAAPSTGSTEPPAQSEPQSSEHAAPSTPPATVTPSKGSTSVPTTTTTTTRPRVSTSSSAAAQPKHGLLDTVLATSASKQVQAGTVTPQTLTGSADCPTTGGSGGGLVGDFQIDGNCGSSGTGIDWSSAITGNQPVAIDGLGDNTQITQGSDETNWPNWSAGSGVASGQADIDQVYAYSLVTNNNLWGIFGFTRGTSTGSIGYTVELNQKPNKLSPDHSMDVPDRSPGDFRYNLQQQGNGSFSLSDCAKWTGSAWSTTGLTCSSSISDFVYAVSGDKKFVEFALNLTDLTGTAATCPPSTSFATVNLRSRESGTMTSSLKDSAFGTIMPPSNCAFLKVHAGGVRTGSGTVDPLPNGAVFTATPTSGGGAEQSCTITAGTGTCTITVNAGVQYRVTEKTPPTGWYLDPQLDYGSSTTNTPTDYFFQTGTLQAGYTYDVPGDTSTPPSSHHDDGTYSDTLDRPTYPSSGGTRGNPFSGELATSLTNPAAPQQCGIRIALVLDQSGSMGQGTKEDDLVDATKDVINALSGTPSQLAIYTFSDEAATHGTLGLTDLSSASGKSAALTFVNNNIEQPSGGTNWDEGLWQVAAGGSKLYDLVVVLTDGNPTTDHNGTGGGTTTRFATVENAIYSANAIKNLGTRLVTIGIGVDGGKDNIRAISGTTKDSDYYLGTAGDFAQTFKDLATGNCQGVVTVQKQIKDWHGNLITPNPAEANGWQFTGSISAGSSIGTFPATAAKNGVNGFTQTDVTIPAAATPTITIAETQQSGYTLDSVTCTVDGQPATGLSVTGTAVSFKGAPNVPINCVFVNQQPNPASHLTLVKKVVNNHGGTAVASDWKLSASGPTTISNVTTGTTTVVQPGTYALSESGGPSGYSPSAWDCGSATVSDGNKVTVGVGQDLTCTITNTDIAPTLTLVKKVLDLDGTDLTTPVLAGRWTLTATGSGGFSGPGNSASVTGKAVNANSQYTLTESTVPGYDNGSAWSCVLNSGGGALSVTGPNKITLTPGQDATCTITNTKSFQPLTVNKTATAGYDTTYNWTIDKKVDKTTVTVNPGDSATFHYTVTVTPNGSTDSNWTMSGHITVANANSVSVTADVTDIPGVGGGADCTVTGGTGVTIPAKGSKSFDYSCTFTGKPDYSGSNTATASWTWNGQQQSSNSGNVPVTFTRTNEINKSITVQDDKTTGTPVTLGTWNWGDGAHDFTYSVTKAATTGQCTTYNNTAIIEQTGQSDSQAVQICAADVTIDKSVTVNGQPGDGARVEPGDLLTWTITVHNAGSIAYTGPLFTDDLTQALAGTDLADALSFTSSNASVQLSYSAKSLTGTANALPAGATVTVTYSGTVIGQDELNAGHITTIDNTVVATGSTRCDTDCTTVNPLTPKVVVSKTVAKGGVDWDGKRVEPGDQLTWTITVRNVSSVPFTDGALFSDNVSQVLAGTDLADAAGSFPSSNPSWMTVSYASPTVTGTATAAGLPAGKTVTVTYTGTVIDQDALNGAGITTIDNTVVPSGTIPCDSDCTTQNPLTPRATVSKTVTVNGSAGDNTEVKPGDVLAWTITVHNISSVPFSGGLFTDDVTQALAGTDLADAAAAFTSSDPSVALSYGSPVLTGTANALPAGATVTVTYSGTVIGQDALNAGHVTTIDNTVVPTAPVTCSVDCRTSNPLTPGASVAKSVTVNGHSGDGSQVKPGDVLVWTITVRNTSSVPFSGGLFTDDVTQALAGTSLADNASAFTSSDPTVVLSYSSPVLTGTANALPAGATVTVTYSGTVADQASLNDAGIITIDNVVEPSGPTTCDTDCDTHNPLTPKVEVSKTVTKGGVDWDGQQVKAGDVLTWTITVHNASSVPFADGVLFTDDVSQALAGTSLADDVSAFASSNSDWMTVSYASPVVTGTATAAGLPAGKSVTLTYSGTVINQAALNSKHITAIDNTVRPGTGVDCAPAQGQDDQCQTDNPLTPLAEVSKSVSVNGSDGDGAQVKPGDLLVWTITVHNTSSVPFSGELFTDDVSQALAGTDMADALGAFASSDASVVLSYSASTLTGTANALPAGATVTVTYSGTVVGQTALNDGHITTIDNTVVPSAPTTCAGDCGTTNPLTPKADVSKSVTVNGSEADGSNVKPGDVLVWTITVHNTSSVPFSGELFTDDVSQALAGTDLADAAASFTSSAGAVALSYDSPTLTGTANALPAGATVTVTYSGTVVGQDELNAGGITTIDNTVVPSAPTTCAGDCTTENPLTPKAEVSKSVTVNGSEADGANVKPGDVLTWTITVQNTGSVPFSGGLFTDDVSQALAGTDLADVVGSFTSSDAAVTLTYSSPVLTGTANGLAAGATVTVTYSGRVIDQAALNDGQITTIDNTVVPTSPTTCAGDCGTHNPLTPGASVAKSVTVNGSEADGANVKPGDVLTWTITVQNTGSVPFSGGLFTDDVSQALAGTDLADVVGSFTSSDPAVTLSYSSQVLTGTANALPAGVTVTVTYSGTVIGQDQLNTGHITTIDNTVVPSFPTTCAGDCITTNPLTPQVVVAKSVTKDGADWDGKQVQPGDVLNWTITVHNTGSVPASDGPLFTDNVSSALAGTSLSDEVTAFSSSNTDWMTVSYASPVVTGTATAAGLPAGETVTVTYTGTVINQAALNEHQITTIDNVVVPQGPSVCITNCTTQNPLTPKADVAKSVTKDGSAWDGKQVKPGDQLTWTITVHNTSSVPFSGGLFSDDVSQALAGTDLADAAGSFTSSDPAVALSYSSPTLTGTATALPAGATVTVRYSGTVIGQDELNAGHITTIDNTVVPSAPTTCAGDCTTENPLTPGASVAKSVTVNGSEADGANVKPGDVLVWTITVHNTSSVPFSGELFTDDVSQALAGTDLADAAGSFTSSDPAVALSYSSPVLTGTADALPAGATVTVSYSGTVIDQAALNAGHITTIDNTVVPSSPTACAGDCSTTNPLTPKADVSKSVTVNGSAGDAAKVKPGDVLVWTITVRNTSSVPFSGGLFTDDVSQALAGTTLTDAAASFTSSDASVALSYSSPVLTGTASGLAAGAAVTVTYSGTVIDQAALNSKGITTIDNTVVPSAPTTCAGDCTTTNPLTPKADVSKSVTVNGSAGDGAKVKSGDVLVWTITVRNTSSVPFSGELFSDDVSQALAGTDLADAAASFTSSDSSVALSYSSPVLTGTAGALPAGATVTVTYSGTVVGQTALNDGHITTIDNTVVPSSPTTCDTDCTTTNPLTPKADVAKSVTVNGSEADGAKVKPGDVLVWTITVRNTSSVPFSGGLFTDDVSQALAGTDLADEAASFASSDPSVQLSYAAKTLTGTATALPAGATVTVTYTGTVINQAALNAGHITTIDNTVVPASPTTCAGDCSTTNPLTPKADVSKSVTVNGSEADGAKVKPGDVLVWTITVRNTSSVPFSGGLFTDDVSQALAGTDLADVAGSFTSSDPAVQLSYSSPVLTGTANALPAGATVTVTYSGTVISQAALNAGHITTIDNTVVPSAPTTCAGDCTTENPLTPGASVAKSVTVNGSEGDGAKVKPGDVLVWTITVHNTSSVPFSGELFTDDVSQALAGTDLADAAASFTSSDPATVQLSYAAKTLTGTADALPAGATVTVTYSGTVIGQDELNDKQITTIDNVVVPSGPTTCDTDCNTHNPLTPKVEVSKTVTVNGSVGDGAEVKPGDVLVWTITVHNASSVPFTDGVLLTDDVSQALAGTDLAADVASFVSSNTDWMTVSFASPVITGTATAAGLPAGKTVTLTYSGVVVSQQALNDGQITTIDNTVLPGTGVDCVPAQGEDDQCRTTNPLTPKVDIAKSVTVNGDPGDGTHVKPGDLLTWTITVHNTGSVVYDGPLFTDDVSQALAGTDLADALGSFISSDPAVQLTYSSPVISGTASGLAAGATVTVTYSGTVDPRDQLSAAGITTIDNVVVPSGEVPTCAQAADCDTTNPVAPRLTLIKNVVNGSTGTATSPAWTLSATDGAGASPIDAPGQTNSTGPSSEVTSGAEYALAERPTDAGSSVTDGYVAGQQWDCNNANRSATFDASAAAVQLSDGADVTCTITNTWTPAAGAQKSVTSTVQNADGSWTVTYTVTVQNPDSQLPTSYDLTDTPRFGDGIAITGTSVTDPESNTSTAWDGLSPNVLATDRPLAAGATEVWTVAITATVPADLPVGADDCDLGNETGTGFYNEVTITSGASTSQSHDCSEPVTPTITKSFTGPATQVTDGDGNWNGTWAIPYTVTVSNPATPDGAQPASLVYTLTDTPQFPVDVTVLGGSVAGTGADGTPIAGIPGWDGAGRFVLVDTPRTLRPGQMESFQISVLATVPVRDSYDESTCSTEVPALWNEADVVSGSFRDQADACGFLPQVPTPSVAKAVDSTTQDADGTWTVVYHVDVTNPSDSLATQYDLTDTLAYGAGITVNAASVTGPAANESWDGVAETTVAAGQFLSAGATASYTVTVNATVTTEATADDRTCQPQGPGGFRNDSHVGLAAPAQPQPQALRGSSGALLAAPDAQGSQDATACSEPVSPEIAKTFVSAMQHAGGDGRWDGTWDVTYTVTVSNPSATTGLSYDLSDTPGFPSDVMVNGGTVSGTDSGGDPITVLAGWNGTDHTQIVTGRALPAGGTDTYTVVVNATVPTTISTDDATCSQTGAQHGFFNAAEAISGEDHFPAQDCGSIPQLPTPTVAKTVTSLSQNADGTWTVVYDLAVTNPSVDRSSEYDLSDTLRFGAGITVASASVTGPDGVTVNPDWTGIAPDTSIVTGRIIAPHTQEHYTVTVIASVAATATGTDRDCTLDEGEAGTGLLNEAELTAGTSTSTSTACAAPVSPTITKTVASVTAAGTGRWIVAYDVTVSNPSEATGLVYSLTDRPGFPAEVGISDQQVSWVHSLLDGSATTDSQSISGWTGMEGGDTLATDRVLPAGSKDTYRVVVTASVPVTVDDELTCSPAGAGHGFFNEATVFSGGDSMTATACADIEPTIEVLPTSSTATPPPPTTTTTISVLPTSSSIAYTGVNTSGMGWLAFLLLGAGALLLAVGTLWRRKPRRH